MNQRALWPPLFYIRQYDCCYNVLIVCISIDIFLFLLLVTYLQWNSRTPPAELCPLLPLSLPWKGALEYQLLMSFWVEDPACHLTAQLRWWNNVNHLWPFWGCKLMWYTFAKCLDELKEWSGEVQLHPSHWCLRHCHASGSLHSKMSSECGEWDRVFGRRGRERNHDKGEKKAMWERREDDHHTFHTCSADLISVSYTYEPAFSIFFLALMALFTSSCASITAFPFCVEGKQRRGEGRKREKDILWAVSFWASSLKSPSFLAAKACSHLEKYLSTSSSASAAYLSFTLPSSTMDSSCCSSWLMPSTTLLKSSLFSIVSKVQFESEIPSLDLWRCQNQNRVKVRGG